MTGDALLGYYDRNGTVVRLLWRICLEGGLLGGGLLGGGLHGGGLLGGGLHGEGLLGGRSLADIFLDHDLHWPFIGT